MEDQLSSRTTSRLRAGLSTVVVFAGVWLILGDRASGPHRWWGALIGLIVAVGLVELLSGLRAPETEWSWRAAGAATIGAAMLLLGVLLTDSWRWVAAGAWPVAVVVLLMLVWPAAETS